MLHPTLLAQSLHPQTVRALHFVRSIQFPPLIALIALHSAAPITDAVFFLEWKGWGGEGGGWCFGLLL